MTSPVSHNAAGSWWRPAVGVTWQWQLSGNVDTSVVADVYDVDLYDVPASLVASLRARGTRVVCYLSAGTFEDWRSDASSFPAAVRGAAVDGWPGERWLDVRRLDVLGPIMAARMDLCRAKGFDGVEPDNVDGYANGSGFPLSGADQLAYNRMLANLAHERGLAIGLKNDLDQVTALAPSFDFAVNEQCAQYGECSALLPFVSSGKPVFHAEYSRTTAQFCPVTSPMGFSSIRKRLDLGSWRETC